MVWVILEFIPRSTTISFSAVNSSTSSCVLTFSSGFNNSFSKFRSSVGVPFGMLLITRPANRARRQTLKPLSNIERRIWRCSENSCRVMKPKEPRAKEITGGTMCWNIQEAKRTVPSPPSFWGVRKSFGEKDGREGRGGGELR